MSQLGFAAAKFLLEGRVLAQRLSIPGRGGYFWNHSIDPFDRLQEPLGSPAQVATSHSEEAENSSS